VNKRWMLDILKIRRHKKIAVVSNKWADTWSEEKLCKDIIQEAIDLHSQNSAAKRLKFFCKRISFKFSWDRRSSIRH